MNEGKGSVEGVPWLGHVFDVRRVGRLGPVYDPEPGGMDGR